MKLKVFSSKSAVRTVHYLRASRAIIIFTKELTYKIDIGYGASASAISIGGSED